jgi:hypothetical protein
LPTSVKRFPLQPILSKRNHHVTPVGSSWMKQAVVASFWGYKLHYQLYLYDIEHSLVFRELKYTRVVSIYLAKMFLTCMWHKLKPNISITETRVYHKWKKLNYFCRTLHAAYQHVTVIDQKLSCSHKDFRIELHNKTLLHTI